MNINRLGYSANILLLGFKWVGKRRDLSQWRENISLPGLEPSISSIKLSPSLTLELEEGQRSQKDEGRAAPIYISPGMNFLTPPYNDRLKINLCVMNFLTTATPSREMGCQWQWDGSGYCRDKERGRKQLLLPRV